MTIFGKSRDLKTKTPKTQAACVFLSLHAGGWMVEKMEFVMRSPS